MLFVRREFMKISKKKNFITIFPVATRKKKNSMLYTEVNHNFFLNLHGNSYEKMHRKLWFEKKVCFKKFMVSVSMDIFVRVCINITCISEGENRQDLKLS